MSTEIHDGWPPQPSNSTMGSSSGSTGIDNLPMDNDVVDTVSRDDVTVAGTLALIDESLRGLLNDAGAASGKWLHNLSALRDELSPIIADNLMRAAAGDAIALANLEYCKEIVFLRIGNVNEAIGVELRQAAANRTWAILTKVISTVAALA